MSSRNLDLPPPVSKKVAVKKSKTSTASTARDLDRPKTCPTSKTVKKANQNQSIVSRNAFDLSFRSNNASTVSSISAPRSDEGKEFEDVTKKLAYNEYLESLFLETLVDEKIERERSEIDVKMAELESRLQMDSMMLHKTNARLKEISFLSQQQR